MAIKAQPRFRLRGDSFYGNTKKELRLPKDTAGVLMGFRCVSRLKLSLHNARA